MLNSQIMFCSAIQRPGTFSIPINAKQLILCFCDFSKRRFFGQNPHSKSSQECLVYFDSGNWNVKDANWSRSRVSCRASKAVQMDWQGQKHAEQLMQLMLVFFAVVAFITGYVLGSFQTMMLVYAAGVVLTSLITIPNWPFFNCHPLSWLNPSEAEKYPKPPPANSGLKKKSKK